MTSEREIGRLLDRWLADGPTEVADRVIDDVAERIGRQHQQPAWRVSWRDSHVNAYLKPLIVVAAVVVIAVAGVAVITRPAGPGFPGTASPSASPSLRPTASPIAVATPRWDNAPVCGEKGCGGPLSAGTYSSRGLKPAVTYTLTSNWVNIRDWPEFFMLYPDTEANRALAAVGGYAPYILVLPGPTTVSPSAACPDESAQDAVEVDAAGFVEFLQARQHLSTSAARPVTVSGLHGQQIDVTVQPGWTGCLPGTPLDRPPTQAEGSRYIVLDQPDGNLLMISLWAPSDFDAFVGEAMPIVDSFRFDRSN